MTQGTDQLIAVHLNGGNDLVLCLQSEVDEERVGELVGIIANHVKKSVYDSILGNISNSG